MFTAATTKNKTKTSGKKKIEITLEWLLENRAINIKIVLQGYYFH